MASILKGGLALALIILIVANSSFHTISVADARISYNHGRQLACNSVGQSDLSGCGGGGGGECICGSSKPGSSLCKGRCCRANKMGKCTCC